MSRPQTEVLRAHLATIQAYRDRSLIHEIEANAIETILNGTQEEQIKMKAAVDKYRGEYRDAEDWGDACFVTQAEIAAINRDQDTIDCIEHAIPSAEIIESCRQELTDAAQTGYRCR